MHLSNRSIYPTLMELCGLKGPDNLGGQSILPLLKNPDQAGKGFALGYWHNRRTIRHDRFRLTEYTNETAPAVELFDHKSDPNETQNVADQFPEVVARMQEALYKRNFSASGK